ncbi:MAG TPA: hypothetical protein VFL76_10275 [Edaphocola sp.]|nr:hypothetical protein [Edaphocola sp.]
MLFSSDLSPMGSGKNLGNPDSRKSAVKTGLLFIDLSFGAGHCVSDRSGYPAAALFSIIKALRGIEADSAVRRARPIQNKMFRLPADTTACPGRGPDKPINVEKT